MGGRKEWIMSRLAPMEISKVSGLSIWTYKVPVKWDEQYSWQRLDWPTRTIWIGSLVFVKVEISKWKCQVDSQIPNPEFRERAKLDGHICESSLCRRYPKPWAWMTPNTTGVIKDRREKNSKDWAQEHTNSWSQDLAKGTQKKQLVR